MTVQTWRHVVTDISTGDKFEFIGERDCPEALKKYMELPRVELESQPVEVCPTCKRPL